MYSDTVFQAVGENSMSSSWLENILSLENRSCEMFSLKFCQRVCFYLIIGLASSAIYSPVWFVILMASPKHLVLRNCASDYENKSKLLTVLYYRLVSNNYLYYKMNSIAIVLKAIMKIIDLGISKKQSKTKQAIDINDIWLNI